jgi:hypothetical protein
VGSSLQFLDLGRGGKTVGTRSAVIKLNSCSLLAIAMRVTSGKYRKTRPSIRGRIRPAAGGFARIPAGNEILDINAPNAFFVLPDKCDRFPAMRYDNLKC